MRPFGYVMCITVIGAFLSSASMAESADTVVLQEDELTKSTAAKVQGGAFVAEGWQVVAEGDFLQFDLKETMKRPGYAELVVTNWDPKNQARTGKCNFFALFTDEHGNQYDAHLAASAYGMFRTGTNYTAKGHVKCIAAFGTMPTQLEKDVWHKLQYRQIGGRIIDAIDGQIVIDAEDGFNENDGPVLDSGHVTIRCMIHMDMSFRNLKIYEKDRYRVLREMVSR